MQRWSTRALVEAAVMIGLATALSFWKVYQAPQGGSVTAGSMIPILLVAVRWGPGVGLAAGAVYGIVQFLVEPFFVHPVQFFLDYPLAFGLLGLAGFFARQPAAGAALGIAGRFVSHYLSGVVFFAEYAPAGVSPWVYSAAYNAGYLVPELIVSAVLVTALARALKAVPAPGTPSEA